MNLRSRFPLLVSQPDLVFLDTAASSQRVDVALEAVDKYYREMNANVHRGLYPMSEQATEAYESVRGVVQQFLNAGDEREVVFTRGTTESLNLVAHGYGKQVLQKGDEILISVMEHHSHLVPWQMVAEETGAELVFVGLDEVGNLDMDALHGAMTDRTKVVAVTGLSNTLGTVVDLKQIAEWAHDVGAVVSVDGAQMAAHFPVNVQELDVDFFAFSSHKVYGPTGAGVLWAKREHLDLMEPIMGGGGMIREVHMASSTWNDVPWKFEAGTPSIAQVLGMGAALEFLMEIGMEKVEVHDRELMEYALSQLDQLSFVRVLGPGNADQQSGVISFEVDGVHPHDVSAILGEAGVCVRAGHHCTMPLMQELGVVGTTRASFGVYNTKKDVDRLVAGLEKVKAVFCD